MLCFDKIFYIEAKKFVAFDKDIKKLGICRYSVWYILFQYSSYMFDSALYNLKENLNQVTVARNISFLVVFHQIIFYIDFGVLATIVAVIFVFPAKTSDLVIWMASGITKEFR